MERPTKLRRETPRKEEKLRSPPVKKLAQSNYNLYQQFVERDVQEAAFRDEGRDRENFLETCNRFRNIVKNVAAMKEKNPQYVSKPTAVHAMYSRLRKLNRLYRIRLSNIRDQMYETKKKVDNSHLQWQNLLYEIYHLKKETAKCLSFTSQDEEIELVDVEEFYENAPASISRMEITTKDSHQLRLARLEWELQQRKRYSEMAQALESQKNDVEDKIRIKEQKAFSLKPMINEMIKATKPVQEHLGLVDTVVQKDPDLVDLLSHPLYFLSIQTDAMRQIDKLIDLEICGDREGATRFNSGVIETSFFEDSDSESESGRSHHHARKKTKEEIKEEKMRVLLTKHPLTLKIKISTEDGKCVTLELAYFTTLDIVTVFPIVEGCKTNPLEIYRSAFDCTSLLDGIYKNDFGEKSPNVANHYLLKRFGIDFGSASELGVPYMWAQKLCGLKFACEEKGSTGKGGDIVAENMVETFSRIRNRLKDRYLLYEQLEGIYHLSSAPMVTVIEKMTMKCASRLVKLEHISWEEYAGEGCTRNFVASDEATYRDLFYKTTISRDTHKLTALIVIKPDFPKSPSFFSLKHEDGANSYTVSNSNSIYEIERELNDYCPEESGKDMLLCQTRKLLMFFDIYLECTRENFVKEKYFTCKARGRERSLPLKFIPQDGGRFVQR